MYGLYIPGTAGLYFQDGGITYSNHLENVEGGCQRWGRSPSEECSEGLEGRSPLRDIQLRMRASSATVLLFIGMLPGMMYR